MENGVDDADDRADESQELTEGVANDAVVIKQSS
jgi:hypothetical protein